MTIKILIGDVRNRLAEMPNDSVDCIVTSPPYWGLRDYGVAGQIGLEPTLGEHLSVMVQVFRELRRVLKPSGTCWLNYGDCYATSPNGRSAADTKAAGNDDRTFRDKPFSTIGGALKPKDLCMIPNRLAIALQEDGWWVRSEIIWAKPNPMPESIKDRPGTSHEKIFLLTKGPRYFYDALAVRMPSSSPLSPPDGNGSTLSGGGHGRHGNPDAYPEAQRRTDKRPAKVGKQAAIAAAAAAAGGSSGRRMGGFNERWDQKEKMRAADLGPRHVGHVGNTGIDQAPRGEGRNLRNYEPAPMQIWEMATASFSDAHFATFPPELALRCVEAGCPKGGSVLDPFGGAGTVGLVADRLGLDCQLIELNPEYAEIARKRIAKDAGMFSNVEVAA